MIPSSLAVRGLDFISSRGLFDAKDSVWLNRRQFLVD